MNLKQGDLAPKASSTLTDGSGNPVNLAGATVRFELMHIDGTAALDKLATIDDAAAGKVSYQWVAGDTDTVGAFRGEWKVTFSGGTPERFPQRSYVELVIKPKVTGT